MITSYFGHVAFQVWDYRNNGVGVIRVDGGRRLLSVLLQTCGISDRRHNGGSPENASHCIN